jgi:large subunit ribosomal protein L13
MKTYSPKPDHIERRWYVLDADEQVLGRLASEAAHILRGKHKPIYAPHMDVGDHVIVVNADKVVLTGGKETKKIAWRHSGHPGGITGTLYEDLLRKRPAFAVEKAVRGMLPKNRLGRSMLKKLHVVAGPEHRHQAQKPSAWTMGMRPAWEGLPSRPTGEDAATPSDASKRSAAGSATAPSGKAPTRKPSATKKQVTAKTTTKKTAKSTARKTTASSRTTSTSRKTSAKATASTRQSTARKTTARKTTARSKKET